MKSIDQLTLTTTTFLSVFLSITISAQTYVPYQKDSLLNEEWILAVEDRYHLNTSHLDKKKDEDLINFYGDRHDLLVNELEQHNFYSDKEVFEYFDRILDHIIEKNPSLKAEEIRLYIGRSSTPNAYCLGDGTVVFNLSLLRWLENESQVAFVLCHEIAHQTLNHAFEDLEKYVAFKNSKETKQKIKEIERSEFNIYEQLIELYKDFLYTNRRYSRIQETQADAEGLAYFTNTDYDIKEALRCLDRLDQIDETKPTDTLQLAEIFDFSDYPFKASWLEEEVSMFNDDIETEETFQQDSIKTHPDCPHRIELLTPKIKGAEGQVFLQDSTIFSKFRNRVGFEEAVHTHESENIGRALYRYLRLQQQHPEDVFAYTKVGSSLMELYHAMKAHDFEQKVVLPNRKYQSDYYDLLRMLHNMRSSEVRRVAYYYLKQHEAHFLENEDYFLALFQATSLMNREEEIAALKQQHKELFPNGKHTSYIH